MKHNVDEIVTIKWSGTDVKILEVTENGYLVKEIEKNGVRINFGCYEITKNMIR